MYRLPSCAECVSPTWLALGLDQSPSSLLPAWYQFWSFRAAPPSQFRRGRRTDLYPRGRVPPIPEVPGRALTPNSSKRLHIHAVPSSSMPARPFLYTPPGDPTRYNRSHWPHSTLASRDSGEMSSQWGRSFPARFHLMMGPMSGSASCLAAISSGFQPGVHL